MRGTLWFVLVAVGLMFTVPAWPGRTWPAKQIEAAPACEPTRSDMLGPFYKAGAPVRSRVGQGFVLAGTVRSVRDCAPLGAARVEFWLAGPDGRYTDEYRATVVADGEGRYRFESHFPSGYVGRPPHIHIRVSAAGHQVLVTQFYPQAGQREGTFDLVLRPQ